MDIRAEKLWLIERIAKIKDERLLTVLKSMVELDTQQPKTAGNIDFWDELSETQMRRIKLSIGQLDDGEGIPHEAAWQNSGLNSARKNEHAHQMVAYL